jgi:hypothetical protein
MIPFFRRIRKNLADDNKPLQYMRYAVGEIVLVVIGILMALQINNWNEERKAILDEKNNLISVYHDLNNDIGKIAFCKDRLSSEYAIAVEVMEALEHIDSVSIDSAWVVAHLGWDLSQVIPVERDHNTWDELKVRGTESHIINDSLKARIDKFYERFDRQIERFNQLPKKVRQDLRELTGSCHTSESIKIIRKSGFNEYGASAQDLQRCILSNKKTHALTGTIAISCLVNIAIYEELQDMAEHLKSEMEAQFDFI